MNYDVRLDCAYEMSTRAVSSIDFIYSRLEETIARVLELEREVSRLSDEVVVLRTCVQSYGIDPQWSGDISELLL